MDVPSLRSAVVSALGIALLAAGACSSGKSKKKKKKKKKNLPPAQVDLPDPPPKSAFDIPEKNPDGTFRVRGLIAHGGKHLGEEVKVKGVLTFISPECDPAKAKKKGEECPEPYLYIRDEKNGDAKLMGVGFKRDFVERGDLKEKLDKDKKYVFEGVYKKVAHGFVATEDGLLLLNKVGDEKVVKEDEE